jgi:predicted ester cyclase
MKFILFSILVIGIVSSCSGPASLGKSTVEQSNKSVAVAYFEQLVNKRKLELVGELFSPDFISHNMDGKKSRSIKDNVLVPYLQYLFKAFPDFKYAVTDVIAEGEKVAIAVSATGTHQDEFMGIKGSGNKINYKETYIFKMADHKILEGWVVADINGLEKQLKK